MAHKIMKERYRIENVQRATVNGRAVKIFSAYEYEEDQNAYVFCGQFSAPRRTTNENLVNYIPKD